MKNVLSLFLIASLFIAQNSFAQSPKHFEVSVIPGFATFSTKHEQGMSLTGEFLYKFNRWVNPALRISSASGFRGVDEGMGTHQASLNALSLNACVDILGPKNKHAIQAGGGPGMNFEMYNYILGRFFAGEINREVNEIVAEGRFAFALNYFVRYRYRLSDHFLLGLEWSESGLLTNGRVKQSALSFTFTAIAF